MNKVDEIYKVIRRNIRITRKRKMITQRELADLIGVSEGYISDIERDSKNKHPSTNVLMKISDALNIDFIDLLKGREKL